MTDVATLVFDIDSSQARGAAKVLADLNSEVIKTANGVSKFEKTMRDTGGRFTSTSKYVRDNKEELESLARAYNPVLAAQMRYRDEAIRTGAAVKAGVITEQQRVDILQRVKAGFDSGAAAAHGFASAQRASGASTANVFAQLNDIGVMLAAGQNPFQLAIQQGTQLNQVWTSMGAQGRTLSGVAGVLRGAIGSMISPMSLLTLGVIAGAGALVQWATSGDAAGSSADALRNKLSTLDEAIGALNGSLTLTIPDNYDRVLEKFGSLNEAVRTHVSNMDALNAALINTSQISVEGVFSEVFGGYLTTRIDEMRIAFARTNDNARVLVGLMRDVDAATGPQKQADALEKLIKNLVLSAGGIDKMNKEQIKFVTELENARRVALQGLGVLDRYAPAISRATVAAGELGAALASAMAQSPFAPEYGRFTPFDAGLTGALRTSLRPQARPNDGGTGDFNDAKKDKSGGGGRALEQAKKQFQSLRELIEEDTLFQFAEYEKRQTQLDNALSRKLLSEQNYNMIRSQLQTLYFGTEYEKQQLQFTMEQEQLDLALSQKLISEQRYAEEVSRIKAAQQNAELSGYQTFFGNMASAAKAGGDKTSAAVKAFSVAQGILNSYLAYTQVLADPSLIGRPFLRTALAASTLAAGLGAVASMKSGGGSSAASTATAAAKQEPTRTTLVKLEGDEWLVNLADSLITQIQDASKDGRMIVMRDY